MLMSSFLKKIAAKADEENKLAIIEMVDRKYERLLEVGPGDGKLSKKLVDLGKVNIAYGLEYPGCELLGKESGLIMKMCDIQTDVWPFDDSSFDLIISNQVIEHVSNTDYFVEETYRLLRKGGIAIISAPNLASWDTIISLIIGWQPRHSAVSDIYVGTGIPYHPKRGLKVYTLTHAHLRLFTTKALRELFEEYGFSTIKSSSIGYGIPVINKLCKVLIPRYGIFSTVVLLKE